MSVEGRRNDKNRKPLFDNHRRGGWFRRQSSGETQAGGNRILMWSPHKILIIYEGKMETLWWETSPTVTQLTTAQCTASFLQDSCQEYTAWVWTGGGIRQTKGWPALQNKRPVLIPLKVPKERERPESHSRSKDTGDTWPLNATQDPELSAGQERKKWHHWDSWQNENGVCGQNDNTWQWLGWLYAGCVGVSVLWGNTQWNNEGWRSSTTASYS